jgi:hypothetical protein
MTSLSVTHDNFRTPISSPLRVALLVVTLSGLPQAATAAPFIVGDGTAASCTQSAVQNALIAANGSTIRFRCGSVPVTISLTGTEQDPNWGLVALIPRCDTTIDGGGLVTFRREDGISLLVRPGITVVLKNLGLVTEGTTAPFFHALVNLGTLTINASSLHDNAFNVVENDGTLFINNTVISQNGLGSPLPSPIVNNGISVIGGSTIVRNSSSDGIVLNTGLLKVTDSIFSDNGAETGGAIANYGSMTVNNSQFSNNFVTAGGAINSHGVSMTVNGSTFRANRASFVGGAIWGDGPGSIDNCQFVDNFGDTAGGAISGANLAITQSTFFHNRGLNGGAISGSQFTVRRSTFVANEANWGGAIESFANVRIIDSAIVGNTASVDGGGIYAFGVSPTLKRTLVIGNTPNDIVIVQ